MYGIFIVSWNWGAQLKISGALMESPQKLQGARAILSKLGASASFLTKKSHFRRIFDILEAWNLV